MLAGLQEMSFIPGTNIPSFVPGVAPSYDDIVTGRDMVRYDRIPVRIKTFHAEVFDLMSDDERKRYEDRMTGLVLGIQKSECVIWKNDLQIISTKDGQHWMRYLEWAEYELHEHPFASGEKAPLDDGSHTGVDLAGGPGETVFHKGVLQEIGEEDEQGS